jgi:hypothetical protein
LEKALKMYGIAAKFEALSPKEAEFKVTNLANDDGGGFPLKIDGFSDENALKGNASTE